VAWLAVLSGSALLFGCIGAFLTDRCNTDTGDWSCVSRFETFTRLVLRSTPVLLLLALLGRKGTRLLTALAALAMAYDCIMIDMMR